MSTASILPTNPLTKIYLVDDWISPTSGNLGWTVNNTGTGSPPTMLVNPDSNHQGVLSLNTGTTATGHSTVLLASSVSANTMKPYSGSFRMTWYVQVPVLSNGTDRFQFCFGFGDLISAEFANGIYFCYDDSTSANWLIKTSNASTRTVIASSVAVSAGAWTKLEIFTSNAAVSYSYAINGTTVGTISSNIPTSDISPVALMIKSIGTTARSVYIDYFVLNYNMAVAR